MATSWLGHRDRVQAFLQELRGHDRPVVVRLADRRLEGLDHSVVVGLVEVDERDEILVRRLGLRREHAVPVGLPPVAAPAGETIAFSSNWPIALIGSCISVSANTVVPSQSRAVIFDAAAVPTSCAVAISSNFCPDAPMLPVFGPSTNVLIGVTFVSLLSVASPFVAVG